MSELRTKLDRIFGKYKNNRKKALDVAEKQTGQKRGTLSIYLWRWQKTGSTGKGVKNRKHWKGEVWNKGKGKKKGKAKKAKAKKPKPAKSKKLRGAARKAEVKRRYDAALAPENNAPRAEGQGVA
jgi:hypothetical protein